MRSEYLASVNDGKIKIMNSKGMRIDEINLATGNLTDTLEFLQTKYSSKKKR